MTTSVETLVHGRWIIPVEPELRVLQHHAIAIDKGVILDILPSDEADQRYTATDTVRLENHALIPGLINTHGHAAMTLFRGLADDLPLMTWLHNHIWPAEGRWVDEDFVSVGTELAIAEMLRYGTTCFSDMYFFPDKIAQTADRLNMRAQILMPIIDFPTPWARDADEYLDKGLKVYDQYRNHDKVEIAFGPHAPYTLSDESLERVRVLADELDAPVQIHLHETAGEIEDAIEKDKLRPIERLHKLGLLSPRLQCVHMTQVTDEDIALLKENGCHVVHCPESNLKLASGFCPTQQLLEAGVNVSLGTDGAASNNDLDLLGEMRTAAMLAKGVSGDASAVPAHQALRMATLNGAQALGISEITGSLETGKAADITAVDLSAPIRQPLYDPISHLVYAASSEDVSHVWVAGELLLDNKQHTQINLDQLNHKVQQWRDKISAAENQQDLGLE